METPKVRFAMTFLDYLNRGKAVNDELMINKDTGQIYYKRPDGKIIPCTGGSASSSSTSYESSTTYEIIANFGLGRGDLCVSENPRGLYTVTNTVINPSANVIDSLGINDLTIYVDPTYTRIFVNVQTRASDRNYVDLLTSVRNAKLDKAVDENVKVTWSIRAKRNDSEGTYTDKETYTTNTIFNRLCPIVLPETFSKEYENYEFLEIQILYVESLLKDVYNPTVQRTLNLFKDIIPPDDQVMCENILLVYFTPNYETVIVNEYTSVTTITDSNAALKMISDGSAKAYIHSDIIPLIQNLYNAGLSTSRTYRYEFEPSDWVKNYETGLYEMEILSDIHDLAGDLIVHLYYMMDGKYRITSGKANEVEYEIYIDKDRNVRVATPDPFEGKLLISNCNQFQGVMWTTENQDIYNGERTSQIDIDMLFDKAEDVGDLWGTNAIDLDTTENKDIDDLFSNRLVNPDTGEEISGTFGYAQKGDVDTLFDDDDLPGDVDNPSEPGSGYEYGKKEDIDSMFTDDGTGEEPSIPITNKVYADKSDIDALFNK